MPELPPAAATAPLSLPVSSSPSVASEADDEYAAPLLLPAALPSEGRGRFRVRWWALLGRRQERGEEARPDCEAEEAASARTEAMRHSRVCMCMCVCECAIGTGGRVRVSCVWHRFHGFPRARTHQELPWGGRSIDGES